MTPLSISHGISISSIVAAASDKAASAASCLLLQLSSSSSSSSYWHRIHATFNSCSSSGQTMRIEINHDVYITALCRHQPNDCAYTRLHNCISSSSSSSSSSSRGAAGAAAAGCSRAIRSSRGSSSKRKSGKTSTNQSKHEHRPHSWGSFENALYEIKMQTAARCKINPLPSTVRKYEHLNFSSTLLNFRPLTG